MGGLMPRCLFCGDRHDWFDSECGTYTTTDEYVGVAALLVQVPLSERADPVVFACYESLVLSAPMSPGLERRALGHLRGLLS